MIDFGDRYSETDRITDILQEFVKKKYVKIWIGNKFVTFTATDFVKNTGYKSGW